MKVLVVGDVHGDTSFAHATNDVAVREGITTILQVGDFGVWPGPSGRYFLDQLDLDNKRHGVRWVFLPGNHEDWNQLDYHESGAPVTDEGFYKIRDSIHYTGKVHYWEWEGKTFKAVGGAYSIDKSMRRPNVSWWVQEQLTDAEVRRAVAIGETDYLFTHDAPTNVPFTRMKVDLESQMHRQKMDIVGRETKAYRWFHGHYHHYMDYMFDGTMVVGLECNDQAQTGWNLDEIGSGFYNRAVLDIQTGETRIIPS